METVGTVISLSKQWWLKINKKAVRFGSLDGAVFPYITKIQYTVNKNKYIKRKWISPGGVVPVIGSSVTIVYDESKPSKSTIKNGF